MSSPRQFLSPDPKLTDYEKAKFVIVPAPYERTTSYMQGTVNGPQAILEASDQVEFFDSETGIEACDHGIHTVHSLDFAGLSDDDALKLMQDATFKVWQAGKFPFLLGGEHTVSAAPVRAAAAHFGAENISVLHFDAHSDMREAYEGNPNSHASVLHRIQEVVKNTYSIGIRAQCKEERAYINSNKDRIGVLYDHEREREGIQWEQAERYLPTEKVYLTIDLDYFAPELVPSVGTPVPGGGQWYETLAFLKTVFEKRDVIGADLVELKPDRDKRSDFLAAQLVYKILTYKALRA